MHKDVPDLSEIPLHQFLPRRHASCKSYISNNKKKKGKAKKKKKKSKGNKTNLGPKAKNTNLSPILPQIKGAARKLSIAASESGSIISGGSRSSVPHVPFYKRSATDRRLHLLGHTRHHHRVGLWDHHHEDQKKLRELAKRKRALAHHVTEEEEEKLNARHMKASDDFSQLSKPKPRPWMTSAYCEDGYYDMKNHLAHSNEGDELDKVSFATPDSEVLAAYAFVMKSFEHTWGNGGCECVD